MKSDQFSCFSKLEAGLPITGMPGDALGCNHHEATSFEFHSLEFLNDSLDDSLNDAVIEDPEVSRDINV